MEKKQLTIRGLISDDFTPMIDDAVASFTKDPNIDKSKLEELFSSREKMDEVYDILEDQITTFFLTRFTIEEFKRTQGIAAKNSQTIVGLHEDLFHYFVAYVHTSHRVYHNFISYMVATDLKASALEKKDLINLVLYGNVCRLAEQILLQLMNGYPDAALILWRTLYEYCVVAVFLIQQDSNELAIRFRDYSQLQAKRRSDSYVKRYSDMKFPAPNPAKVAKVDAAFEKLEQQYGKDFFRNEYEWAAPFLNGAKATFNELEAVANFGRFRPFYIWASGKTHPTYLGIMDFRDSSKSTVLTYITEPETARRSFVDPAQLTVLCFDQLNDHFLHRYSGHESEINMKMLRKIIDKFGEALGEEKVSKTDAKPGTNNGQ